MVFLWDFAHVIELRFRVHAKEAGAPAMLDRTRTGHHAIVELGGVFGANPRTPACEYYAYGLGRGPNGRVAVGIPSLRQNG